MSHGHFLGDPAELAALYAVGSMAPDERAAFEAHLDAGCEACRDELRQLDRVMAALATAVPPANPGPQMRERLLERAAAGPVPKGEPSPLRSHLEGDIKQASPGGELFFQRAAEARWENADVPGVRIRVLYVDRAHNHFTALVRMAPGTSYPGHIHGGPEECLVLEGDLHVGDEVMLPGDYQRAPAGSTHGVQRTENGCLLLITSSLSDVFA